MSWDALPYWIRELVAMLATLGAMAVIVFSAAWVGEQRRRRRK